MKLTCPDCRKPVSAADVNIQLGIGKCVACDAVFNISDQVGSPLRGSRRNMPLKAPKHYVVDDFGPDLAIRWSWFTHAVWFLVFFALFWDGFLLMWYASAFAGLRNGLNAGAILFLVFPLIHVAVGVGITYACLCCFMNRTEIKLAGGELAVWHGPLPVFGSRRIPTMDIRQLYCTEKFQRSKHGGSFVYTLSVLLQSGERIILIGNMREPDEVLYLERALEERLKLTDERVPGDWVG
ncbi:hypothetical protein NA78x_000108 [Anatilimnocola sp. NA78]|uniref:hypothetical protein n=1 Tax=Anatilimnocola sp. NA78 TaxID=3415683 RepID=UPI003CE4CA72